MATPHNFQGEDDVRANFTRIGAPRGGSADVGLGTLIIAAQKGGYGGPVEVPQRRAKRVMKEVERMKAAQPAAAASPSRMRFVTLDEVCARPRRAAIIKTILYESTVTFMFGQWGSFKSFILFDMAAHLGLGLDWCGNRVREPRDVLFIAAEGEAGIRDRMLAWQKHTGHPRPARLRLLAFPDGFQLGNPEHVRLLRDTLASYAAEGFRPSVIIVDTLAATTSDLNENAAEDMGPVLRTCRQLAENAAVVLIDHTGKDDPDGKKGPRGWSGKLGNADAAFLIRADPDAYTATMSPYKPPKDGPRPKAIGFKGQEIVLGEDEDGDPITSLAFSPTQRLSPTSAAARRTPTP